MQGRLKCKAKGNRTSGYQHSWQKNPSLQEPRALEQSSTGYQGVIIEAARTLREIEASQQLFLSFVPELAF
jgi:hypothetical protein